MMTVNLIFYQKIKCEFVYTATAMKNITKDYQLGFGSFVDKTVSPFIRTEYVYVVVTSNIQLYILTSILS